MCTAAGLHEPRFLVIKGCERKGQVIAMQRLHVIGWLFLLALVSGLGVGLAGKALHAPLSIVHKLAAVTCMVFLVLRIGAAFRLCESRQALLVSMAFFATAFLAAFVSGIVQSIPSQAGTLWLNLHRVAAIAATVACAGAWRLMTLKLR